MIHDIDLVLDIMDDELEEVDAFGASVLSAHEDLALARLQFQGGGIAMVKTSRVALNRSRKIRIFCDPELVDTVESSISWEEGVEAVEDAMTRFAS